MSSLEEVSNLLVEQNTVLALQADATMNTNKEIKKLTGYFTGLDAEERRRESSPAIDVPAASNIESEGRQASSGITAGMLITPGVILDLAKRFAFRLLRGGLIVALADNIGKAVSEFFGAEEFQGEITRALTFAGFGSIFGAKFAIIAGALGAVLDEETLAKITPIIEDISKSVQQFAEDYLPSIDTLQKGLITGLEGIRNLLSGDFKAMWEGGQVEETLLLLAGLGAVLMPGKAIAVAIGTAKLAWTGIIGSIKMLGGLAGLVSGAGAAAAASSAGQLMTDSRGRQYVSKIGKDGKPVADYSKKGIQAASRAAPAAGGAMGRLAAKLLPIAGTIAAFMTGKVGLAILGITSVAALGAFAVNAFFGTKVGKKIAEENVGIGKALDDMDGPLPEELSGYNYSPGSMSARDRVMADLQMTRPLPKVDISAEAMALKNREKQAAIGIMNAPSTTHASSSTVQHNQVMNSGSTDPADQVFGGNLAY